MNKLKQYFKIIIYPFLFIFGQFLIEYIFVFMFNKHQLRLLKNTNPFLSEHQLVIELNKYIKTKEYKTLLNNYINSKALLIILITLIIFLPIFLNVYNKYRKKRPKHLKRNDYIFIILLGISVSVIFNVTFNFLNNIIHFTNNFQVSSLPIIIQIISSGIVGPVIEELLFRGIVYNKLKLFNKNMRAIVISSIIFALFHISSPLNVLYAFMMSFFFIYLYEKYKNLWAPILLHIISNTTVILIMNIILKQIFWINMLLWLLMLLLLIFVYYVYIKPDVISKKT